MTPVSDVAIENAGALVNGGHTEPTPDVQSTGVMERLQAKSEARAKIVDEIARVLWENGEMLAQTEGGAMPSWKEVLASRTADGISQEFKEACWSWWVNHTHSAEALLSVDASGAMTIAKHLMDSAARQQRDETLALWGKVERAAGYEPGSLTGKEGVKQRVFL